MAAINFPVCGRVVKVLRVAYFAALICGSLALGSCASFQRLPKTLGEHSTAYGYIPVDALPVVPTLKNQSCTPWFQELKAHYSDMTNVYYEFKPPYEGLDPFESLTDSLPDINVRFAVASVSENLGFNYGPAKVTVKGSNYQAVLDYINVDTIPVTMRIRAIVNGKEGQSLASALKATAKSSNSVSFVATTVNPHSQSTGTPAGQLVTIPVYVGVGLRLSADVRALSGGIALTSLSSIGADAQAKKLIGTLTVQTIGIAGSGVNSTVPLPSRLDETTIENAILSIGSIRAVAFKNTPGNAVRMTPQVVGIYSPVGSNPALINAIYAELSRHPPKWDRACRPLPTLPAREGASNTSAQPPFRSGPSPNPKPERKANSHNKPPQ